MPYYIIKSLAFLITCRSSRVLSLKKAPWKYGTTGYKYLSQTYPLAISRDTSVVIMP